MGQRLVEHQLTLKVQALQLARGIGPACIHSLKPRGVSLIVVADDDPAKMMTLEVHLLQAGDEIPAGAGFMGMAEGGTFVFGREVAAAEFAVPEGGGLQ